jgi:hypothetical protein
MTVFCKNEIGYERHRLVPSVTSNSGDVWRLNARMRGLVYDDWPSVYSSCPKKLISQIQNKE